MATETITGKALEADIYNAIPTEKVDGTCCYVTTYEGNKEDPYADFSCWLEAMGFFLVSLSLYNLLDYICCELNSHYLSWPQNNSYSKHRCL